MKNSFAVTRQLAVILFLSIKRASADKPMDEPMGIKRGIYSYASNLLPTTRILEEPIVSSGDILSWTLNFNNDCTPNYLASGQILLECTFIGPQGGMNYAEIRNTPCDSFTDYAGGEVTNDSTIGATLDISHLITDEDKNSGEEFSRYFCVRADVFASDGMNVIHLLSKKASVTLNFVFPDGSEQLDPVEMEEKAKEDAGNATTSGNSTTSGTTDGGSTGGEDADAGFSFSLADIVGATTVGDGGSEVVAPWIQNATSSASFGSNIEAYRCNGNGDRDTSNTPLSIGDILYFCVENLGSLTTLSSLTKVGFFDTNGIIAEIISADGISNFVSSADCTLDSNKKCLVTSLITPRIFDRAEEQSIVVAGVAGLSYIDRRHLRVNERQEESVFWVRYNLQETQEMPQIVLKGVTSPAVTASNSASLSTLAAVVVLFLSIQN